MASYNVDRDFDAMRQEAIERVRAMQRRSREIVAPPNNNQRTETPKQNPEPVPPIPEPEVSKAINENENTNTPNHNANTARNTGFNNQTGAIANILGSLFPKGGGQTKKGPLSELLDGFNISEENALIGILIYILAKNGADVKLLLGLGYLLL